MAFFFSQNNQNLQNKMCDGSTTVSPPREAAGWRASPHLTEGFAGFVTI
jgi:hypothetical protein